jgi:uncharacterized protein (TIGR03067 family)
MEVVMALFDLAGWSVMYFAIGCGCANEATIKEIAALEGEWEWAAIEVNGRTNTPEEILGQKWVIKGNIITAVVPGTHDHQMLFRVDQNKGPKEMDLLPLYEDSPKRFARLTYRLDGETLRVVCAEPGAKERPTEGNGETMVFRKVKR